MGTGGGGKETMGGIYIDKLNANREMKTTKGKDEIIDPLVSQ
jgi:hypothetical protein